VLLDRSVIQIDLALGARGLARHYRFVPAARPFDDPSAVLKVEAFEAAGLRPYPVAHLRVTGAMGSDIVVSWTRRTRIDGDSWQSVEVPLGEEAEAYLVRVREGETLLAETVVTEPRFTFGLALQAGVATPGEAQVEVAQVSAQVGPGPFRSVGLPG
jgi:hypothetical protein